MTLRPVEIVLANQRLTNLVVDDEITRPLRLAIYNWADGAPEFSVRERLATLVECKLCVSMWAAAAVLVLDRTRLGRLANRILAVSQAAIVANATLDRIENR